jgi:hypothetical protein
VYNDHLSPMLTPVPEMKNLLNALAEGHVAQQCRDDRTAIELFGAGAKRLETTIRAML